MRSYREDNEDGVSQIAPVCAVKSGVQPISVGVNARYLGSPLSGVERYITELIAHAAPADCRYSLRSLPPIPEASAFPRKIYQVRNALWDRYMNYIDLRPESVDIFHAPSFVAPRMRTNTPLVVTVHDLAFLVRPEFFDRRTRAYLSLFFPASLREAMRIICVSQNTADDLVRFFPTVRDRVRVVLNGYKDFSRVPPRNDVLARFGLSPERYVLCVGALNARKNIAAILDLCPRLSREFPDCRVVVVGRLPESQFIKSVAKNVCFTGHVSDEELSALYRGARLFVYPSRYEGFGFPILEAMSVGTPVACSNNSCLPEIAGIGPENYFDPNSSESIYRTIASLLEVGRGAFDARGAAVSLARFSWKQMYEGTLAVYRECVR